MKRLHQETRKVLIPTLVLWGNYDYQGFVLLYPDYNPNNREIYQNAYLGSIQKTMKQGAENDLLP